MDATIPAILLASGMNWFSSASSVSRRPTCAASYAEADLLRELLKDAGSKNNEKKVVQNTLLFDSTRSGGRFEKKASMI